MSNMHNYCTEKKIHIEVEINRKQILLDSGKEILHCISRMNHLGTIDRLVSHYLGILTHPRDWMSCGQGHSHILI